MAMVKPGTGQQRQLWRPTVAGMAGMIVVGSSVGVSRTLTEAPLFTAQALRYAAAAVLLIVLARWSGIRVPRPRGPEWLWLCGVAATGLVLFNVAVVRGVAHAEPAVIAVAVACAPVLIGVFGPLLEGGRPTRRLVGAAIVVTAGGVLVVGAGRTDLVGLGWAVLALLCEAGFTLLAVPVLRRLGPWGVSIHAVWIAAVALAVVGAAVEGPAAASRLTSANWVAIGYLAVMVTAVAFVLWYSAVGALGSGTAGLLTGVAPVAAAASGALLGGGLPAAPVWCGIFVVFCGLVIGLRGRPGRSPGRPVAAGGPPVGVADRPPISHVREPERSASRTGTMDG